MIPNDVIAALGIKEGDDLDFLEYVNSTHIYSQKKKDLVKLLAGAREEQPIATQTSKAAPTGKVMFNRGMPSVRYKRP